MMLLTKADRTKLLAQGRVRDSDKNKPVVKFFMPTGAATWLISELDEDGDTMFGLCDLGQGSPELGNVSLREISRLRGRFNLPVERDRHIDLTKTLADYARDARHAGRIVA